MNCLLFKLRFTAPVHFGSGSGVLSLYSSEEHFLADTLFSALCHTALQTEGKTGIQRLLTAANSGSFRLSDAMPWHGDTLYLPKPCVSAVSTQEMPASMRKAVKKMKWIPVSAFDAFSTSIHGGKSFLPEEGISFGVHEEHTKAAVHEGKDAEPYQVGAFRFADGCGLWFICECNEQDIEWMKQLVTLLGYSGIGGEISSGYGSFEIDDLIYLDEPSDMQTEWLCSALSGNGNSYLLLTSCLPEDKELDSIIAGASFQLVRRGGFVQSETFAPEARKKETQYFLAAGAVVSSRFEGTMFDVGNDGKHPVFRYSKPILLGVSL